MDIDVALRAERCPRSRVADGGECFEPELLMKDHLIDNYSKQATAAAS